MKNNKEEQPDRPLSARRTAEQFWEDLMNTPYNNDKVGQAFVKVSWKRLPESEKPQPNKTDEKENK